MAIANTQLGTAVQAWLMQQGLDPSNTVSNAVVAMGADGVASIVYWNTAVLGPQPTLVQLEAALANVLTLKKGYDRTQDMTDRKLKALARAVHVRFGRPDAATMSAATWQAMLEAAWDAVN